MTTLEFIFTGQFIFGYGRMHLSLLAFHRIKHLKTSKDQNKNFEKNWNFCVMKLGYGIILQNL